MTFTIAAALIGALTGFCYALVRQFTVIQNRAIAPFMMRMHMPNAMKVLTDEEHFIIHGKIDVFNLRMLTCFIASIVAVGMGLFFLILVSQNGNVQITGYIMSVLFAYVAANYNLGSSVVGWIRSVENDLLARVLVDHQEASEFNTLGEYLDNENKKMMSSYYDEMSEIAEEFEAIAAELGLDPDRNYDESEEAFEEFLSIMDKAQQKMAEKYPNMANNFSEPREK